MCSRYCGGTVLHHHYISCTRHGNLTAPHWPVPQAAWWLCAALLYVCAKSGTHNLHCFPIFSPWGEVPAIARLMDTFSSCCCLTVIWSQPPIYNLPCFYRCFWSTLFGTLWDLLEASPFYVLATCLIKGTKEAVLHTCTAFFPTTSFEWLAVFLLKDLTWAALTFVPFETVCSQVFSGSIWLSSFFCLIQGSNCCGFTRFFNISAMVAKNTEAVGISLCFLLQSLSLICLQLLLCTLPRMIRSTVYSFFRWFCA